MKKKTKQKEQPVIRLDIGCGSNKREGFTGVDQYKMPNVDVVLNVVARDAKGKFKKWPWADNSVDEVHCSHFLEHLTGEERVWFVNELHRILKPKGKASIITPHWCSNRAYGDFTHQWPPVAEMWYYYLSKEWRAIQAPHTDSQWNPDGLSCDFDATWGYSFGNDLAVRNQEYQQFALLNYKEAAQDLHATLIKRAADDNSISK